MDTHTSVHIHSILDTHTHMEIKCHHAIDSKMWITVEGFCETIYANKMKI